MKAFEFQARVNKNGSIQLPDNIRERIHDNKPVRILLLCDDVAEKNYRIAATDISMQDYSVHLDSDALSDDY